MYGSRKKTKAVLVAILAIILLVNAALPMTVMGKSKVKTDDSDYQYYVIKKGDTLTRIAKNYGVTISDIMTANNIANADRILAGNVIKVPLSSTSPTGGSWVSTRISMNLVDANVQDVLSAIAKNAGYTIIFVSDSNETLTVNLEQMTALKAVDYVTRLAHLSYLKDGNTLMVGTASELNSTFVDKVVMSRFNLDYITVDVLQAQASALGLENVQYVVTEQDDSTVYISAYPKELAKIQELITLLDVSSNIKAGGNLVPENFTYIDLTYIDATEFSGLLGNLGLDSGIVLSSRPYTLYTFATGAALTDIKIIKNIVDKPLTGKNAEAAANSSSSVTDETVNNTTTNNTTTNNTTTNNTTTNNTETNTSTDTNTGTNTNTNNTATVLREIPLEYIDRDMAVEIVNSFPYQVTIYGPEKMTKKIWLAGTEDEVSKAEAKVKEFDTDSYAQSQNLENSFFVYDCVNITAQEMLARLQNLNLGDVTFKTNSYEEVSKSLIVYCPMEKQEQIKKLLDAMDTATTGEVVYRAVEVTLNSATGQSRIASLRQVHPEIPDDSDFQYISVTNKSGDSTTSTTYVKATPEMVDYIKALLAEMETGE